MYSKGQGVPKDFQQAIVWYRKAAEQRDLEAQYQLGLIYSEVVEPQDYKQAMVWFSKAAEQGHVEAQHQVGLIYWHGRGVPRNNQRAIEWFRKAAEQGYYGSQFVLGLMYGYDDSVPRDDLQAYAWFSMLVANGYDTHEAARDEIAARLTPERLAEAQAIASRYFEEYQSKSVKASAGRP